MGFLDWLIMLGGVAGSSGRCFASDVYDPERMGLRHTPGEASARRRCDGVFVFAVLGAVLPYEPAGSVGQVVVVDILAATLAAAPDDVPTRDPRSDGVSAGGRTGAAAAANERAAARWVSPGA